jgi:hypothetical protein
VASGETELVRRSDYQVLSSKYTLALNAGVRPESLDGQRCLSPVLQFAPAHGAEVQALRRARYQFHLARETARCSERPPTSRKPKATATPIATKGLLLTAARRARMASEPLWSDVAA